MKWRLIQISGPHHQLDIKRPEIDNEAANRLERENMEIRLRREAAPLAHQAGHQLAVIDLSLFFIPMHIVTALYIGDGFKLRSGSSFKPFL
jgi:hypothetical protein